MNKDSPVWSISKDVGVKSPMFSIKSKEKTVPLSSVLTPGVLLGVANLEDGGGHLQTVPEHDDTTGNVGGSGGGGGPDGLGKPRRKFGSITSFLPSNKQVNH